MTRTHEDGGWRTLPVFVVLVLAMLAPRALAAQSQSSQDREEAFEPVDPYTKGERAAIDKAGYVSFGPFLLANGVKSQDVEEALGTKEIHWLETEHFRIGSTLRSYKYRGDPREDKKLDDEVKRLRAKLPTVKPGKNKLDPWLRLHLYAARCEAAYADFLLRFDVRDAAFADGERGKSGYMGDGPYLGMEMKFTVLLAEKKSSTGRFFKHFCGIEPAAWQRQFLDGSMCLGIDAETLREYGFDTDAAMHATVASELVLGFVESFRKIGLDAPRWFEAGLAHAAARNVDPRYALSAAGAMRTDQAPTEDDWSWEPRVYGLVFNKAAKPFATMMAWTQWDELKGQGHLIAWSRATWLVGRKDTDLHAFLMAITEDARGIEGDRAAALRERQTAALEKATGKKLDEIEAEWRQHVLRTYDKK